MRQFSYQSQSNNISVSIDGNHLHFAEKQIAINQVRFAISYYAAAQWEQQVNTFQLLKEKVTGKVSHIILNKNTNFDALQHLIPKATSEVPVYLDLVDSINNRTLIPLNLADSNCHNFLNTLIALSPQGYLGMGSENETSRALGLQGSSKILLYILIALGFFLGMMAVGIVMGR